MTDLETRVTKIDDSISRLEQMFEEIAEAVAASTEVAQAMSEALNSMIPNAS